MATPDFSELGSKPAGENLEGPVRLRAAGPHGVPAPIRDGIIFTETQPGLIESTAVHWLVSCTDNSKTDQSVSRQDVGSIVDKVRQHDCTGFLLTITTTVCAALNATLDGLQSNPRDQPVYRCPLRGHAEYNYHKILWMLLAKAHHDTREPLTRRKQNKNIVCAIAGGHLCF
jgi:hypothetical protein